MVPRSAGRDRVERARELRGRQTPAEAALWQILRGRQLRGLKFRRQAPLGSYVVDFLCPRLKLVLECDGGVHDSPSQREHDENRERYLQSMGYHVLRFANEEILQEPELVLRKLETWIRQ